MCSLNINIYLFENSSTFFSILEKIATVIIAICSLGFSIYIFAKTSKSNSKKEINDEKRDSDNKKLELIKTILLTDRTKHLLGFFDNLIILIENWNNSQLEVDERQILNELIKDEHNKYRIHFYDLLSGFNASVYDDLANITDELIDDITNKLSVEVSSDTLEALKSEIILSITECRANTFQKLLNI